MSEIAEESLTSLMSEETVETEESNPAEEAATGETEATTATEDKTEAEGETEEVTEDENGLGLQFDKADWNIKEIREIYKAAKAA